MCSNPPMPNGTLCNDNNPCTQTDTCMAGACTGGNPVVCAPVDMCTLAGSCDMSTGMCSMGMARNCDDNNPCTMDSCVPATGCVNMVIAGCVMPDGGLDASPDTAPDGASDAAGDGPRDGAVDRVSDGATDGRATDGAVDRAPDTAIATDGAARDSRDGASTDGAAIRRVGGGGGCDCDVGRRGPGGTVHTVLLLGLAMVWWRRRRRP
jgi:MYXO-CTERM domain-containing protein